jgi:hypothetical protein
MTTRAKIAVLLALAALSALAYWVSFWLIGVPPGWVM